MVEISEKKFEEYTKLIWETTKVLLKKEAQRKEINVCIKSLIGFQEKYPLVIIAHLISQLQGKKSLLECAPIKNLICKIKREYSDEIDSSSNKLLRVGISSEIDYWERELKEKYKKASVWVPVREFESVVPKFNLGRKLYKLECGLIVSEEIAEEYAFAEEYKKDWEIVIKIQ